MITASQENVRKAILLVSWCLAVAITAAAQQPGTLHIPEDPQQDGPAANPGRPTISTPATLTPAGYFQFETGYLGAWHSPEFSSQSSVNEVVKFSVSRRIELQAELSPFARSAIGTQSANGTGSVSLGVQGLLLQGGGARPALALSYFRQVSSGNTPDLDIGSPKNSAIVLVSADVKGFHYDSNFLFNDTIEGATHRAQFGQTLSVSHGLGGKFGLSGEIWHFTQPFLRRRAVGTLWALNYNARKNLVIDSGFDRGLTRTSTRWEVFVGFTYVLPHKARLH